MLLFITLKRGQAMSESTVEVVNSRNTCMFI